MKTYLALVLSIVLVLVGPACGGGGGGGGGGGANFQGNYFFQTRLTSDGCDLRLGPTRDILYDVKQDGDRVVVENLVTGAIASGSVVGNGWIASSSAAEGNCTASAQIVYDGASGGGVAFGVFCLGSGECSTEYSATVIRD